MKKRLLQYLYFWLYTTFALFIPIYLIIERYGFLDTQTPSGYKWASGLIIGVILSIFYFRKHLGQAIDNLPNCTMKYVLVGVKELSPLIAVYIAFLAINLQMDNITFIMKWSCISNGVSLLFRTLHLRQITLNNVPPVV